MTSLPGESAPAGCSGESPSGTLALDVVGYEVHLLHLKEVEEMSKILLIQLSWLEGGTALNHRARLNYVIDRCSKLSICHGRIEDQLDAAREEMQRLGELAHQESDAPQVIALVEQIREGEHGLVQTYVALATAGGTYTRLEAAGCL